MDEDILNLIKLAKNKDKTALEKLIKKIQPEVYSTLYFIKKDDFDINDIAQDILVKVSKKISQLKNIKYFKTWLNQIVINTYYDYLRKLKRQKNKIYLNNIEQNSMFEIPDYSQNLSDIAINNELDLIIKTSINDLPIHYKIPITLREIQGLSYDEISNITKTSLGTVKSRIARARALIKEKIDMYSKE